MKNLKLNSIISLILIFLVFNVINLAAPKTKVLVPKNSKAPISIIISGKSLKYYPLSVDESSVLTTRGPGKLKIITRGHFNSPAEKRLSYNVYYRINGAEKIKVEFNGIKADDKASFEETSMGFPSIGENIIIELSRGEHTIEIWSGSKNLKISTRVLFTEIKEKKIDWVSLSPMYPNEPVSLVTNEDVVSYYRYSSSKPLKLRVTGPTTLRVMNRVEFDYKMKGKLNFRVEVKEDKKVKNTYMLCTDRSDVAKYKKDVKRMPGKAKEIVISVPSGTHTYEIITLDKCSVLGRILFPKKDIKLESN
ncbi:MAG TPA: hypothetical protein VLH59_14305 [Ignavibacteriaceae bacterium]|nr:hypothetical protein [Ignavibacteriaceae bacterium]